MSLSLLIFLVLSPGALPISNAVDCDNAATATQPFSKITGRCTKNLDLRGKTFSGSLTLAADAWQDVDLRWVTISGALIVEAAPSAFAAPNLNTLDLSYASIGGGVYLFQDKSSAAPYPKLNKNCPTTPAPVAQIATLRISHARVGGSLLAAGISFDEIAGDHLTAGGQVVFDRSSVSRSASFGHLRASAFSAVSTTLALSGRSEGAEDDLSLEWSKIDGNVDLNCARLGDSALPSISLFGASIGGAVQLYRVAIDSPEWCTPSGPDPHQTGIRSPDAGGACGDAGSGTSGPCFRLEGNLLRARQLGMNGNCNNYLLGLGNAQVDNLVLHAPDDDPSKICSNGVLGKLVGGSVAGATIGRYHDDALLPTPGTGGDVDVGSSTTFRLVQFTNAMPKPDGTAHHPLWSTDKRAWLTLSKVLEANGQHNAADCARMEHNFWVWVAQKPFSTRGMLVLLLIALFVGWRVLPLERAAAQSQAAPTVQPPAQSQAAPAAQPLAAPQSQAAPAVQPPAQSQAAPFVALLYWLGAFVDMLLPDAVDLGFRAHLKKTLEDQKEVPVVHLAVLRFVGILLTVAVARYLIVEGT